MEISKDRFVIVEYDLRLEDGSYVKGGNGPVSMNFVAGYAQVLPALEKQLLGAAEGAELEFVIPAGDAFGNHEEKLVRTMTFEDFPAGRKLEIGKWAVARNEDTQAQYSYLVLEKTDSSIKLDYNHPLAGKNLHYRIKVVHVREALKEELEEIRPCEHGKAQPLDD
ncbi:MAG: FKBP-type peptidyl-prolyl cis-trans isomerase [Desulfobacteraceae bacterium]|nr:FKBP-type peptidyl-prolyl cis-trans isomerase [Desulfobacteraceae bacterium]